MRAVAFPSPVASQPPDAVDQLLYSDRLLTAKEVARLLSISEKTVYSYVFEGSRAYYKIQLSVRFEGLSLWPIHHGYPYRCASPPAGSSANQITAKSHFVSI